MASSTKISFYTRTHGQVHSPETMHPEVLDFYLANGWFRTGQTIFTTHFLRFDKTFYSAFWLRHRLDLFEKEGTFLKLEKRNAHFEIKVQPLQITAEKEALYAKYKEQILFEASESLHYLLYHDTDKSIYSTFEIGLYDGGKLVALGIFDIGFSAAQGICCFYDHAYKKYSPGKYLIYLKLQLCKQLQLTYFYPGYFSPGYTKFDYKADIHSSSLQYYNFVAKQWRDIKNISSSTPLDIIKEKLSVLQNALSLAGIYAQKLNYEYYNANLILELKDFELFDHPVFVYLFLPTQNQINPIVVYDVREEKYLLLQCRNVAGFNNPVQEGDWYKDYILKIHQIIFQAATHEELVSFLQSKLTSE